jgi:hypothetical protein
MEKIEITDLQKEKLIKLLVNRKNLGVVFFIIGISGFIPIGITFFGSSDTSWYSSGLMVFFIIGVFFWNYADKAIKNLKNNEYHVYKSVVLKVSSLGYVHVVNNEILSKNVNKPTKSIEFLSSIKSVGVNDEIGIIQVDKREFWGFAIND